MSYPGRRISKTVTIMILKEKVKRPGAGDNKSIVIFNSSMNCLAHYHILKIVGIFRIIIRWLILPNFIIECMPDYIDTPLVFT